MPSTEPFVFGLLLDVPADGVLAFVFVFGFASEFAVLPEPSAVPCGLEGAAGSLEAACADSSSNTCIACE